MNCKQNHKINQVKESTLVIGIEPTGHYWFDFGEVLENEGIKLVMFIPATDMEAAWGKRRKK